MQSAIRTTRNSLTLLAAMLLAACDAPGRKPEPVVKESTVTRAPFDTASDHPLVELLTLTNSLGMEVRAMSYGATIVSIRVPDAKGAFANVVVGFDSIVGYLKDGTGLGAVLGRDAGHGANGHAGAGHGFENALWSPQPLQNDSSVGVAFDLVSPDGDQGYPGTVTARVTYTLSRTRNELRIDFEASTDKATPVDLTNRLDFNLAGAGTGDRQISSVMDRKGPGLVRVAQVIDSATGRTLDVSTTEPGVQFTPINRSVLVFETDHWSNSPDHPDLPSTILRPGAVYRSQTVLAFGVRK